MEKLAKLKGVSLKAPTKLTTPTTRPMGSKQYKPQISRIKIFFYH